MNSRGKIFRAASVLSCLVCLTPALAKHATKEAPTNIFTPPPADTSTPSFGNKKTAAAPHSILDGSEEPHWDIIKSLPDLLPEQTKALNKLQQETQKFNNVTRTQMNEAQQELKQLKAHRDSLPKSKIDMTPAIAMLNPDGKPYTGPLLEAPEMGTEQSQESIHDVQAQIDGLKERIKDSNMKASGLARAILSQDQLNELALMRDGKLVVTTPRTILVDNPSEPGANSRKKHEIASTSSNAGSRVLRSILSGSSRGLRGLESI